MKYAIISKSSHTVPGDERSRTNPGHGYPEHSVETISLQEFDTEEQLIAAIERKGRWETNYRVIKFEEVKIETKIKVSIA